jgi:uncharacterized protein YceH (UPF0502 family)
LDGWQNQLSFLPLPTLAAIPDLEQATTMNETAETPTHENPPKWQPLNSRQRRVVGVLIEKAKTTPDAYPMTLNALTNGCNQKSNRSPQMNLSQDEVEQILDELRGMGAVMEIQGSGRVPKYRHQMYEWLGVDKVELAVMAELLLRGEQTVGELRGRAARMEPIAGLNELVPIVRSLIERGLVISLTPEGRGQVVTHGLHKERELDPLRARFVGYVAPADADRAEPDRPAPSPSPIIRPSRPASAPTIGVRDERLEDLECEVAALREDVLSLTERLEKLERLLE